MIMDQEGLLPVGMHEIIGLKLLTICAGSTIAEVRIPNPAKIRSEEQ